MKTEILYSRADWKHHKDRLGYDDVIDRNGRFVATVSVMDIAAVEVLRDSYRADGTPKGRGPTARRLAALLTQKLKA